MLSFVLNTPLVRAEIANWKKACWTSIISIFAISGVHFSLQFFENDRIFEIVYFYIFLFNLVTISLWVC